MTGPATQPLTPHDGGRVALETSGVSTSVSIDDEPAGGASNATEAVTSPARMETSAIAASERLVRVPLWLGLEERLDEVITEAIAAAR